MNRSSVSLTRAAYDASFAKLVSLLAYRDSRRFENHISLCDQFQWFGRFVFLNSISASLGVVWERLGPVWIILDNFMSVWDRLCGLGWERLEAF